MGKDDMKIGVMLSSSWGRLRTLSNSFRWMIVNWIDKIDCNVYAMERRHGEMEDEEEHRQGLLHDVLLGHSV
jgi:hypothetical protein